MMKMHFENILHLPRIDDDGDDDADDDDDDDDERSVGISAPGLAYIRHLCRAWPSD